LIPSYRSTDFDVHRNWLSVTRHLPSDQWYFYDANETTVHTLDYPPLFAFFELFWSSPHNFLTQFLLSHHYYNLDHECLSLRPDHDNEPSAQCVVFQRVTVILSDLIFLMGSHLASKAMEVVACRDDNDDHHVSCYNTTMILLLLNPGLLWLDHVHFQYNGMLLGLLLGSMACLVQAFFQQGTLLLHANILGGAILFGLLVGMKHLYLTLAPLYFVYLLRHYCFVPRIVRQVVVFTFPCLDCCYWER
jgi:alpha-1,3-glucosyltransferase